MAVPIAVFLIGGQSNAVGQGNNALSPATPAGQVLQFYNGIIKQGNDPVGAANTGSAWPAFGLAWYNATGHAICFVPTAVSGSAQAAANDTASPPAGNWDASGTLYGTSVALMRQALAALASQGYAPYNAGILWCQGETDAGGNTSLYLPALVAMVARFRSDFTNPSLPFYIFRTGQNDPASGGDSAGWQAIRGAQEFLVKSDPSQDGDDPYSFIVYRRAVSLGTRGMMNSSSPHYNQYGLNEMGTMGAQAVLSGCKLSASSIALNSGVSTIPAATTAYLGIGAWGGNSAIISIPLSCDGIIRDLVVSSEVPPGAGQSYAYTLYKNGVATSLTCSIAGATATTGGDFNTDHSVYPQVTDTITVQVITSAGAAATYHKTSILMEQ